MIVVITAVTSYISIVIAASRPPMLNAVAAVSAAFTKIAAPTSTEPASSARCTSLRSARSRIASAKAAANQITNPAAAAHISALNRIVVRWSLSQPLTVLSDSPTVGGLPGRNLPRRARTTKASPAKPPHLNSCRSVMGKHLQGAPRSVVHLLLMFPRSSRKSRGAVRQAGVSSDGSANPLLQNGCERFVAGEEVDTFVPEQLDGDVVCAGVQVRFQARRDVDRGSVQDHGIDQLVAAAVGEVVIGEAEPPEARRVVAQLQVRRQPLAGRGAGDLRVG